MTEENFKLIAAQLRKPHGEMAKEVGKMMNEGNKLMNLAAITSLNIASHDTIMEIGMGNGYFVKDILATDETVLYDGCDFADTMVAEAIALNNEYVLNKQARFTLANADVLPYDNASFNKVFTVNTIYFWDDAVQVLTEIKRVLQSKGLFIIALRPKSIMDHFPFTKHNFNTFDKTDCIDLLTQNGFEVSEVIEQNEPDLDFFGENLKNEFMVISAIKS
jgi:ubiquinone/menaquinone biosynthesis C-methylase UbiE